MKVSLSGIVYKYACSEVTQPFLLSYIIRTKKFPPAGADPGDSKKEGLSMKMKYVFPAVIERNKINGRYIVVFPELPEIVEHGKTLEDALSDAKTALEVHLFYKEKYNEQIPEASDILSLAKPEGAAAAPVEADMFRIRQSLDTKSVSKTVKLPKWLRDLGEEYNINFSQILREALRLELGIYGYFWE